MKLIIDIDKDYFKIINKNGASNYPEEVIKNGTPIPDNATNGDVIKAMFPSIESRLDEKTGIMLVKWIDGATKTFKTRWWNAPYQKGGKG